MMPGAADYEPDYDAMWQELVELDEQAIFYANHEEDHSMAENRTPTPVSGYTAQPDAKVALVNRFKEMEERLLRELDALMLKPGTAENRDEDAITTATQAMAIGADPRWLAVARTDFQRAYMALNRAVFQPQRIQLPEDSE